MNCETARELLLEADLSQLRGHGELAQHLHTCNRCRGQAQVILDQYVALGTALQGRAPALDPGDPRWRTALPRPRAWRRWPVLVPLALAASLAILFVARPRHPGFGPGLPVPAVASAGEGLDVQGPPGRTVAVFQTDNPNIVVIWSF